MFSPYFLKTSLKLTGLAEAAFHFLTQEIYAEWVCDRCLSTNILIFKTFARMKLSNKIYFPTIQNLPRPGVSAKRKCLWSSSSRSRGSQVRTDQNLHKKLHFSLFLTIFFNLLAGGVAPPKAPPLPSKLPSIQSS